jgi:cobalt-zinc-cadmium efflux system protein
MRQAIHILMEGTPPEIDLVLLEGAIKAIPGVVSVHDLHVWTITSGLDAMSCPRRHRRHDAGARTLLQVNEAMKAKFNLTHTTIQIEDQALRDAEGHRGL